MGSSRLGLVLCAAAKGPSTKSRTTTRAQKDGTGPPAPEGCFCGADNWRAGGACSPPDCAGMCRAAARRRG